MAELAHMNRLETAGQLSASIAHEINQPITGMVLKANAALRWLKVEKPEIDRVRSMLSDIVDAGQRAGDIITSIRAMFKKDENARVTINLNNLVNTALALVGVDLQRADVRVETQLEDGLPLVAGNPVQLQQVILNLVVNANDAMRATELRILKIQTGRSASAMVHLSIEDSGPGITASDRERIFEPLFTTKPSGMGMGLFDLPLDCREPWGTHLGLGSRESRSNLSIRIATGKRDLRQSSGRLTRRPTYAAGNSEATN